MVSSTVRKSTKKLHGTGIEALIPIDELDITAIMNIEYADVL